MKEQIAFLLVLVVLIVSVPVFAAQRTLLPVRSVSEVREDLLQSVNSDECGAYKASIASYGKGSLRTSYSAAVPYLAETYWVESKVSQYMFFKTDEEALLEFIVNKRAVEIILPFQVFLEGSQQNLKEEDLKFTLRTGKGDLVEGEIYFYEYKDGLAKLEIGFPIETANSDEWGWFGLYVSNRGYAGRQDFEWEFSK